MGRTQKKGVEYFSHDTNASHGPTLFTVQLRFGNDGYAFWFKLLEFIGTKDSLYISTDDTADWLFFLANAMVSNETATEILDLLADIDAIDKGLWEHHIIWSDNFAERVAGVFGKRGKEIPQKPVFRGNAKPTTNAVTEIDNKAQDKPNKSQGAEKVEYAEFVKMKKTEYEALCEKIGKKATDKCIEILDNYKGSKGKTYKDDYRAILSWVIEKVSHENPGLIQQNSTQEGGNPFGEYK